MQTVDWNFELDRISVMVSYVIVSACLISWFAWLVCMDAMFVEEDFEKKYEMN